MMMPTGTRNILLRLWEISCSYWAGDLMTEVHREVADKHRAPDRGRQADKHRTPDRVRQADKHRTPDRVRQEERRQPNQAVQLDSRPHRPNPEILLTVVTMVLMTSHSD